MKKRLISFVTILAIVVSCMTMYTSCTPATGTVEKTLTAVVDGQELTGTLEIGLGSGESKTIMFNDEDGNAFEGDVTYVVENAETVRVSKYGLVTGLALGETKFTVTAEGYTAVVNVKVMPLVATASQIDLLVGEDLDASLTSKSVGATTNPTDATLTYQVKDTAVATVSEDGVVTAVAEGSTVVAVTVTAEGLSNVVEVPVVVAAASNTVNVEFNVDISTALTALGLTELPSYISVFVAGDFVGWPSGWTSDYTTTKMTAVEGSTTKFELSLELELTDTIVRDSSYKYILAGVDEQGQVNTASIGYEAYNGSNVDNRPIFLNGQMTMDDTVTVFQLVPGDPNSPLVEYEITYNVTLANALAEGKEFILVGGLGIADGDLWWKPEGVEDETIFTKNTDTTYSITISHSTREGKTPEFKFTAGSWDESWNGGSVYLGTDNTGTLVGGDNMMLDITSATDTDNDGVMEITLDLFVENAPAITDPVVTYSLTFNITLAVAVDKLVLAGAFEGASWVQEGVAGLTICSGSATSYTITIEFETNTGKTPAFKVVDGSWWGGDSVYLGTDNTGTLVGGDNMSLDVSSAVKNADDVYEISISLFVDNTPAVDTETDTETVA